MERPSTASDIFAIVGSRSGAFQDRTVYSVIWRRLATICFAFFVFLTVFCVFIVTVHFYSVSALEVLLVHTALYTLFIIIITIII